MAASDWYENGVDQIAAIAGRKIGANEADKSYEMDLVGVRNLLRDGSAALLLAQSQEMDTTGLDASSLEGFGALSDLASAERAAAYNKWLIHVTEDEGSELVARATAMRQFADDFGLHWLDHDTTESDEQQSFEISIADLAEARAINVANDRYDYVETTATSIVGAFTAYAATHPSPWATQFSATIAAQADFDKSVAFGRLVQDSTAAMDDRAQAEANSRARHDRDIAETTASVDRWKADLKARADEMQQKGESLIAWAQETGVWAQQEQPQPKVVLLSAPDGLHDVPPSELIPIEATRQTEVYGPVLAPNPIEPPSESSEPEQDHGLTPIIGAISPKPVYGPHDFDPRLSTLNLNVQPTIVTVYVDARSLTVASDAQSSPSPAESSLQNWNWWTPPDPMKDVEAADAWDRIHNPTDPLIRSIGGVPIIATHKSELDWELLSASQSGRPIWYDSRIGKWIWVTKYGTQVKTTGPVPLEELNKNMKAQKDAFGDTLDELNRSLPDIPEPVITRIQGVTQLAGAGLEATIGTAGVAAPDPTGGTKVIGIAVIAHSVDQAQAAIRTIWSGEHVDTATKFVGREIAKGAGAGDALASTIGTGLDMGVGIVGPVSLQRSAAALVIDGDIMVQPGAQAWFNRYGGVLDLQRPSSIQVATPGELQQLALTYRNSTDETLKTFGASENAIFMSGYSSNRLRLEKLPANFNRMTPQQVREAFPHYDFKKYFNGDPYAYPTHAEPQMLTFNPNQRILPISHPAGACKPSCRPFLLDTSSRLNEKLTVWAPNRVFVFRPGSTKPVEYLNVSLPGNIPLTKPGMSQQVIIMIVVNATADGVSLTQENTSE